MSLDLESIYKEAYDVHLMDQSVQEIAPHRAGLQAVAQAALQAYLEEERPISVSPEELRRLQHEVNLRMSALLNKIKR